MNWLWSEDNGQKLSAQIEYLDQLVKEIRQVCGLADESKEEGTTTTSNAGESKDDGKTKLVRQRQQKQAPLPIFYASIFVCVMLSLV